MSFKKIFEVAMILSATDNATKVINNTMANAQARMKNMSEMGDKAFGVGRAAAGAGLGFTAILAGPLKAAADMEKMNVALRTSFQGNEKAAAAAFKSINDFAGKTPYELEEVMTGFIKLKNMGLDPGKEALTAYGNTASAMGKSLNDMVEAVADATTGEFERLKEFGIKSKSEGDKVTFTFQGVKTTVGKNSKEIEQYLKFIGNTKFAGGIEAQSKTAIGMFSTLKDNVVMTAAKIGTSLLPKIKELMDRITPVLNGIADWVAKNPQLTTTIMGIVAAAAILSFTVAGLAFVFGGVAKAISFTMGIMNAYRTVCITVTAVQNVMAMSALAGSTALQTLGAVLKVLNLGFLASPIFWVVLAIAGAAFLIIKYWKPITAFFSNLWKGIKDVFMKFIDFMKNWGVLFLGPIGFIIKYWKQIPGWFKNIGGAIIDGLINGIKSKASQMFEFVKNIGKSVATAFKTVLGIASPSKVFMDYGVNITEGASKGMQKGQSSLKSTASGLGKAIQPPNGTRKPNASGGGITVNFAPVISGGSNGSDISNELRKLVPELIREIELTMQRKQRLSY